MKKQIKKKNDEKEKRLIEYLNKKSFNNKTKKKIIKRKTKKYECTPRESNPGQPLGRRLFCH